MRATRIIGAGVAALGLLGGVAVAGGGSAFAATPPAPLTLTGTVGTVETIALNTHTGTPALVPGSQNVPVFSANGGASPLNVEASDNSPAGYNITVNTQGPLTSGGATIPTAGNVSAQLNVGGTQSYQPFAGDNVANQLTVAIVNQATGGMAGTPNVSSAWSDANGNDFINTNLEVSTPGNQAPGTYTADFEYNIIGH